MEGQGKIFMKIKKKLTRGNSEVMHNRIKLVPLLKDK